MLTFKFQAIVPCARCTANIYMVSSLREQLLSVSTQMCFQTRLKKGKIYITIFKFGEMQVRKIGIQENTYE